MTRRELVLLLPLAGLPDSLALQTDDIIDFNRFVKIWNAFAVDSNNGIFNQKKWNNVLTAIKMMGGCENVNKKTKR